MKQKPPGDAPSAPGKYGRGSNGDPSCGSVDPDVWSFAERENAGQSDFPVPCF